MILGLEEERERKKKSHGRSYKTQYAVGGILIVILQFDKCKIKYIHTH